MRTHAPTAFVGVALAAALALTCPRPALAATQAEVDNAQAQLSELMQQSYAASQELNKTKSWLEQTEGKLADISGDLEDCDKLYNEARENLSTHVSASYKRGPIELLDIVLNSSSFEDLTSNLYYAAKITRQDAEAVDQFNESKKQLEAERESLEQAQSEQRELVRLQEQQAAALASKQAAQQSYLDGLSAELRSQIDVERAETEARAAVDEQAQGTNPSQDQQGGDQQTQETPTITDQQPTEPSPSQPSEPATEPSQEPAPEPAPAPEPEPTPAPRPSTSSSGRQAIVDLAMSQLGVGYGYAATTWNVKLDCSGLTYLAYQKAGYDIPRCQNYRNGGTNSQAYVVHARDWKTRVEDLEIGDIVFYGSSWDATDHVGIYCGNGQNIEANPQGVLVQAVYDPNWHPTWHNFVGGGSPL